MYTQFYGLREKPFSLSPDPRFLFLSDSHREALAHLLYGIEQGEGFIAITGEVGTGKTTLCRTLLERLEPGTEVAFVFNPQLTGLELLQAIGAELGLESEGQSRRELTEALNRFLLRRRREGRRVLLIIDEAQNLERDALEQVRLLSNLETNTSKLIQIILIGQPELDAMLESPDLRQLRQRISVRWRLAPLGAGETREYVRHRLRIAGGARRELFTEMALREINRHSRGVPRLINLLCDRALLAAYAAGAREIGLGLVSQVERELSGGVSASSRAVRLASGARRRWPWSKIAVGAGLTLSILVAAGVALRFGAPVHAPTAKELLARSAPAAADAAGAGAQTGTPPVAAAPPSVAAPVPRPLSEALARSSPAATAAVAVDALLARWGRPPLGAQLLSLDRALALLRVEGFRMQRLESTSFDELARFDRPALLLLPALDGAERPVLLDRIEQGGGWIHGLGPAPRRYPLRELGEHWKGRAIVAWRDPLALPTVIEPGMEGPAVSWLQDSLASLGLDPGEPHGRYGPGTAQAVRSFQEQASLVPDGSAGPLTQLRLFERLPGQAAMPHLVGEGPRS